MVVENVLTLSADTAAEVINNLGTIGKWLQAIGLVVIIWIVVHVINLVMNRNKVRILNQIKEDLKRIERKIDKLAKNKK